MMKHLTAHDAWTFLESYPEARLVDVRTPQEWSAVGMPDLARLNRKTLFLTWPMGGSPAQKEAFAITLAKVVPDHATPLLFLCRGGVRSHAAALEMQKLGYSNLTNVADGFEGNPQVGPGWRSGLPVRHET